MAANAEDCRIQLGWLNRRIVGMLRQGSVTRFTTDRCVLALFLFVRDVCMTCFAGFAANVVDRLRGNFGNGRSTIVSILSEGARHEPGAYPHKSQGTNNENPGKAKEVSGVPKNAHRRHLQFDPNELSPAGTGIGSMLGESDRKGCDLHHD